MADCYETPEVIATTEGGVLALPRSSSVRFTLPMVYAGVGIALGILTGTSLAITGMPESSPIALFSNSAPESTTSSASFVTNPAPASTTESAAPVTPVSASLSTATYVPVAYVRTAAVQVSSQAGQPEILIPTVHHAVISKHTHAMQIFPVKTRIMLQNVVLPAAPAKGRTSRPVAHPVVKPARQLLASVPSPVLVPLSGAPQLDSVAATSSFSTEGDLTVVAYDAATGTIESADGRTFAVGQTVSLSNATTWSDYRSDVHYRCGGNGSCTLMRPGVIATDARLI
jgi:hypothetical protein